MLQCCGIPKNLDLNSTKMTPSESYSVYTFNKNEDVSNYNLTINFDLETKRISGYSGCNSFEGPVTIENDSLSVGLLRATERYCDDETNSIERKMLSSLRKANTFEITETQLILKQDNTVLLTAIPKDISQNKKQVKYALVSYKAASRGFFLDITVKGDSLSIITTNRGEPKISKLTSAQVQEIYDVVSTIDFSSLSKIEPPSKKHQFDGASPASFHIEANGEYYQTQAFDHGNPPKELKSIIDTLLSFNSESKKQ